MTSLFIRAADEFTDSDKFTFTLALTDVTATRPPQLTMLSSLILPTLRWLAGWLQFNVPFQHKYGYIRDERSGMESYPYPVKEG